VVNPMTNIQTGSLLFKPESLPMQLAGKLGLAKLRWSLRRLHVPVPKDALVLEVGAVGNPYPRSRDAVRTLKLASIFFTSFNLLS